MKTTQTGPPRRRPIRLPAAVYRQSGTAFAVTIATRDRQRVFSDLGFAADCVEALQRQAMDRDVPVYAYCLMPDHAHLLIGVPFYGDLVRSIQAWKSLCYLAWRRRGYRRSFWQRSFYYRAVRREEDLRQAALYVLDNPVRAGLVEEWREYPLSGSLVWKL